MAQTINADDGVISGSTGLKFTADTTGILALQNNGTTRVTVDASGNVGIGGVNSFDISPAGTGQYPQLATWTTTSLISSAFGTYSAATVGPTMAFIKSRGATVGTNTAVVSGDSTGNIVFRGADGTNYKNSSAINSAVDATVSAGIVPGRLVFSTTDTAGTLTERMRIDSSGRAIFAGLIYHSSNTAVAAAGTTQGTATVLTAQINNVTTGIDGTAGVILPTPIQAGLSIFIRNGSASLSLRIYPHSGGNISGTGVNAAIEIEFATVLEFIAFDTTNWYLPSAVLS